MTALIDSPAVDTVVVPPAPAREAITMRVTCGQEQLKLGLATVSHAVPSKGSLPVLSNVLLRAEERRLLLQATDLETAITVRLAATVDQEGATSLPAKLLNDFVGNLPSDVVALALDGKTATMHLRCRRSEANIKGVPAEEWPAVPSKDAATVVPAISSDLLRKAIRQVAFAAASEGIGNPVFQGVFLRFAGTTAIFVATDGFRLAKKEITLEQAVGTDRDLIVPAKALIAVDRALGNEDVPVRIAIPPSGGQVLFATDHVEAVCRLIDGKHAPYERVLPKTMATRAVVKLKDLIQQARQAQVFAAQSANITKFTFEPGTAGAGALRLTANAAEAGDSRAEADATITGPAGEFAASIKYLLEALAVIPTEQVAFEINTATMPGLLRPVGDDSLVLVVMPMQLR